MYFVVFGGRDRKPARREWKFIQMAAEVDLWLPVDCCGTGVSDFRSGWNKICGTAWIIASVLWAHWEKVKPGTSNLPFSHRRKSTPHGGQLANKRDDNFGSFFCKHYSSSCRWKHLSDDGRHCCSASQANKPKEKVHPILLLLWVQLFLLYSETPCRSVMTNWSLIY